jgi:phospholipid/cholesterol/gamma-HCH transport system permease protein
MTDTSITSLPPTLEISEQQGQRHITLSGCWDLRHVATAASKQRQQIKSYAADKNSHWNLEAISKLDSSTALILWQSWGETLPTVLHIKPEHQQLFERWQNQSVPAPNVTHSTVSTLLHTGHQQLTDVGEQLTNGVVLLGQLLLDITHLIRHPKAIPWAEISNTIYDSGVKALGITALVGFLIGIVLSYLSALQLKMFGAEIYIIDILGISIIRELGPLLAAILVAGRSGSAMTAQIGIMRVTEELDALSAMGISHSLRLILPKVAALTLAMPLLSVWTNAAAIFGGMLSAKHSLDIGFQQFFLKLPDTIPLVNVFIGLGKSAVFGLIIALVACHFGFRIKPNTESLGSETTNSVVAAITAVIMIDALFAILFMDVGMPS